MQWLELSTEIDREAVEPVTELFARHTYCGTVVEEPIIPEHGGDGYAIDLTQPVIVKGYLVLDQDAPGKEQLIAEGLWHLGQMRRIAPLNVKPIAEEDWANAWRAHYQVHRLGKRLVVKPSWQDYSPRPSDVVLELDPGMAFGTGLHPTTQLCLRALERLVQPGMRVLDVGTGSGILAIAAAKLGAAGVLGMDVDPIAITAARANVIRNGLEATVSIRAGSLATEGEQPEAYDLVVANITARALAGLAPALARALAKGGSLMLSGIIADQVHTVSLAFRRVGMQRMARHVAGDWLMLVYRETLT